MRIDVLVQKLPLKVRVWLHLASLLALLVATGFFAWGAFSLAKDSWDFGATDLSALHTPLAIPQGLWAAGLALLLLAAVAIGARALRQLAGGDADAMDRMLMARTYIDEAAETLEAVAEAQQGMRPVIAAGACPMIAIVFIVAMGLLIGGASLFGVQGSAAAAATASVPWWAPGGRAGRLRRLLRRRHLRRRRARGAVAAGGLRPVGPAILELHRRDDLGPVDQLRAGVGAAVPADGRDHAARRAVGAALPRAQHLDGAAARRAAAHQHHGCGVFSAVAGSSVATAATMGSVALPYFEKSHYPPKLVLGSLAAGGALGNLIPPGITFIIYGLITETSVGALYLAAVGPSILVVLLFTAVILYYSYKLKLHGDEAAPGHHLAPSHREPVGPGADRAADRAGAGHHLRRLGHAHRVGRARRGRQRGAGAGRRQAHAGR